MKTNRNRWPALVALLFTYVMTALVATPATSKKKSAPAKKSTVTAKRTAKKPASAGKRPASAGKRPASKKSRTTTARRRTPAPPPRQASPSNERYREIQQALVDRGYGPASADGVWGPPWVDALRRFQGDQNLQIDGKLGALSLLALGLGPKRQALQMPPPPGAAQQQLLAKPGEPAVP